MVYPYPLEFYPEKYSIKKRDGLTISFFTVGITIYYFIPSPEIGDAPRVGALGRL